MPDSTRLAKAQLIQLRPQGDNDVREDGKKVSVQFNPETLKVTFTNQITPQGAGDQSGPAARQFVGAATTKLAATLVFDVTGEQSGSQQTDVRQLTKDVAFFITPQRPDGRDQDPLLPPMVRFAWGSFQFDGIMESMEESLEFFSSDGVPLRATVTLGLTQQRIQVQFRNQAGQGAGQPGAPAGTQALDQAPAGGTVQGMAADRGQAANWRAIAAANGIENPRQLTPGQLINFNVPTQGG